VNLLEDEFARHPTVVAEITLEESMNVSSEKCEDLVRTTKTGFRLEAEGYRRKSVSLVTFLQYLTMSSRREDYEETHDCSVIRALPRC
jgi:predicted enzyme involved in methoxymalonyl-ACP biosynthesis